VLSRASGRGKMLNLLTSIALILAIYLVVTLVVPNKHG
jgi:hypothetical protein